MGILTAGAIGLFGLLTVAMLAAASAQAHAQLIGTAPGDGQTLTTAPADVALEFNGDVVSIGLRFQVIGPDGLASTGKAVVNRGTVTQPLVSPIVNGTYVVNWHVVHDDGHPDSGTFSFAVKAAAGAATAAASSGSQPARTTVAFQKVDPPPPGIPSVWVALGVLVVTFLVVVAVVIDRRRRRAVPSEP